jgi:bacteriocin-like protein
MSNIQKAIKSMANIQESSEEVEQLTSEELEEIEGGFNIGCKVQNTGC